MNAEKLRRRLKRRNLAVAEIIAALLLILISVAAAAVLYTYILSYVGNISQNSPSSSSEISIDSFCASATLSCIVSGAGTSYYIVVRNIGSLPISIGSGAEPSLYFTDNTAGISVSATCNSPALSVPPGGTFACSSFTRNALSTSPGDSITLKVVDPDGGTTLAVTRALK